MEINYKFVYLIQIRNGIRLKWDDEFEMESIRFKMTKNNRNWKEFRISARKQTIQEWIRGKKQTNFVNKFIQAIMGIFVRVILRMSTLTVHDGE